MPSQVMGSQVLNHRSRHQSSLVTEASFATFSPFARLSRIQHNHFIYLCNAMYIYHLS